jgi:opacity protein-like surface antigen
MIRSRSSLYLTTALAGGTLAGLLGSTAAQAQCVTPPSSFSVTRFSMEASAFVSSTVTLPGFQSAGAGALNAIGSVVSTLSSADAAMTAQGSSPFVVASPTQAPDQQGGGVWVRGAGGQFQVAAPTTGVTFDSSPTSSGTQVSATDCSQSRADQNFTGVQVGADVARLNFGGSGGTFNVGLTSGYYGLSAVDESVTTSFQVPFFGLYATATYGGFFADAQIRGNFYQGSFSDSSGTSSQKFNARGFALSGNLGYHYDLPDNWFIEPSIGVNWYRTSVDPMTFAGFTTVTSVPIHSAFPPPTTSSVLGTSTLNINDFDSILGRAGLRVGTTFVNGQYIFQPYFTASVFHEFASPISSTLNSTLPGLPFPLPPSIFESSIFSTGRIGTYGQFGLGLVGQIANTGWTSFVRGDGIVGSRFNGWDVTGGARYTFDPETVTREGRSAEPAGIPAPLPYNWTGFFLGASAPGALWGESTWNFGGLAPNAANNYTGLLAGGGGGFNYQMGALVVGGAVEWDWTNARGGETFDCPANGVFFNSCTNRVNSIFTATARVGYAYDRLLVYPLLGLAVGDVVAQTNFNSIPGSPSVSSSKTSVGWTAGAGFEFGLTQNISAKAEYLYFDLGSDTYNLGVPIPINRNGNIGRVGLNYRFD